MIAAARQFAALFRIGWRRETDHADPNRQLRPINRARIAADWIWVMLCIDVTPNQQLGPQAVGRYRSLRHLMRFPPAGFRGAIEHIRTAARDAPGSFDTLTASAERVRFFLREIQCGQSTTIVNASMPDEGVESDRMLRCEAI